MCCNHKRKQTYSPKYFKILPNITKEDILITRFPISISNHQFITFLSLTILSYLVLKIVHMIMHKSINDFHRFYVEANLNVYGFYYEII